jgi:toxin ParE1/3/4
MVHIIWTNTAANDLIDIKEYISLDSILQAALFVEAIYSKAQVLIKFPEMGKPVPELPNSDYRELLYKRYRIIYRLSEQAVYIISIHHSSRLLYNNPYFKELFQ